MHTVEDPHIPAPMHPPLWLQPPTKTSWSTWPPVWSSWVVITAIFLGSYYVSATVWSALHVSIQPPRNRSSFCSKGSGGTKERSVLSKLAQLVSAPLSQCVPGPVSKSAELPWTSVGLPCACFHFSAITRKGTMNVLVQAFSFLSGIQLGMKWLDPKASDCWTL